MADEQPAVRNKGMLIVALILGVVVVAIYNIQIRRVRAEAQGEMVYVLRFARNMGPGDQLDAEKDLAVEMTQKKHGENLGPVWILATPDERKLVDKLYLTRKAQKGEFLLYAHISMQQDATPSAEIGQGMVAVSIPVDKQNVPGEILNPDDRVNLLGRFRSGGSHRGLFRVIEGVRVLAVGGQGLSEAPGGRAAATAKGLRSYQNVTIELTPEESLLLNALLSQLDGAFTLEVLNPNTRPAGSWGKVAAPLRQLLSSGS